MIKSAVLTGPTGVLGTALTARLAKAGVETYVICHPGSPRNTGILLHPCVHKVECDMENIGKLPELVGRKAEAFFHLAWLGTKVNSNRMDMYLQNTNVKQALDTVYAAQKLGCKVYVGAGSQAEYGRVDGVLHPDSPTNPISGYGMAKLCAGQMTRALCREFGIRHVWPRVVSVYGLHDAPKSLVSVVIQALLRGERPALTAGEQLWDYLYSEDAADAFLRMAQRGRDGAVYVLGSGKTRPLRAFMEEIRNAVNPSLPLGLGEIPYLPDQAMHLEADISALTRDTGWKPTTDFPEGISRLVKAVRHV